MIRPHRNTSRAGQPSTARQVAVVVLGEHRESGDFTGPLLDRFTRIARLSPADARLAREIVYGVVRRQATLDALIQPLVRRPREAIESGLWTLMQIGAYQLVLLDAVPPHAAVSETVDLTRWLGRARWSGFLNGVLRSLSRGATGEIAAAPASDAIPLSEGRYRRWTVPPFPDPAQEPIAYFAEAFSFPQWLADRWSERFTFDELCRLGFWFNAPPPIYLRVNTLRATRDEILAAFRDENIEAEPAEAPEAIRMQSPARLETLPGFKEGKLAVQDLTAMRAARLLAPQPGEHVLDLAAAPGTKSTHLAALMNNTGKVIAADISAERLMRVHENVRRLGTDIVETAVVSADSSDVPPGPFDAVLIDVPCSNTGVLAKRPEARWRISPNDLIELPQIQQRLLAASCDRLKPGGRVVYSTCSIEPEENRAVVDAVLQSRPGFELIEEHAHLPGHPADGGYQALIRRSS